MISQNLPGNCHGIPTWTLKARIISAHQIEQSWCLETYKLFAPAQKQLAYPLFSSYSAYLCSKIISTLINHLLTLELMLIDSTSTCLSGLWEVEFARVGFLSQYWQFQLYPWLENENQLFLSKNISYWLNTIVCEALQLQYQGGRGTRYNIIAALD